MAGDAGETVSGSPTGGTVEITELVDVCDHLAAVNHRLFKQLGQWVTDEDHPGRQQWFAVACHRHAWHADLWSQRRPEIPVDAPADAATDSDADVTVNDADDRAEWYTAQLARMQDRVASLEVRVDPVLDPSTMRVITLVAADLADLATSRPT